MFLRRLFPFFFFGSIAASAFAGDGKTIAPPTPIQDPFAKGVTGVEVLGGYFHSPVTTGGARRPEFDYAGSDLRYGVILTPIMFDSSFLRGDIQFLGDVLADGVTEGPGNYLVGGSILFRYNFVQPGSRIIPYFQTGGGGLHSDASQSPSQHIIGSGFEFILESDLGVRILLNDRWSLLAEGTFQHISNADTAARNVGVNSLGGRIGVGWIY